MAYEYAVSFELKKDDTYQNRYDSLMEELEKNTDNRWDETTSFVLIRTKESIEAFANRLYFDTLLIESKDKLLVIDHAESAAVARGPFKYPNTLKAHFKNCTLK